jgi:hypothetical protein
MNNIKKISIVFLLFCTLAFSSVIPVIAADVGLSTSDIAGTSDTNALIKCDGTVENPCGFTQFITLIQNGLNLVFAFAAFIAEAMFMYAGFLMLTAVGNMAQITKAKAVFRRVIIGILVMFMAFLLVQQLLKNLKLSPQAQSVIGRIIDLN